MSTGGIFTLITNDGKQDRMLMATALLNKRLLEIERMRSRNPQIKDPTPTLVDIERTHILFMNAHFKPFAAIGYEYNKVSVQSGTARLNSEVQFSIPQFGDFFHDMVLHVKLGQVEALGADYWTSPAVNPPSPAAGGNADQLLRYVEYLGQRMVKKVKFTVNGNPLDEYDSDILNFHQKFFVTPGKETGWKRNVGQELPKTGYAGITQANGRWGRGAGVREKKLVCDGPQTAKPVQGEVDMWIPLLFWFNKDPRLAIPSVSIPYGQRFIDVTFAAANEILQHAHASNPALDAPGSNPVPIPDIVTCELFINNIFVNPEIHDIFIKRIGFSLIRVHRRQVVRTSKQNDNILLQQLKWPIETLYVGLRPTDNVDVNSTKMLEDWHMYSESTDTTVGGCGIRDYFPLDADVATSTIISNIETGMGFADGSDPLEFLTTAAGLKVNGIQVVTGEAAGTQATVDILNEWLGFYGFKQLAAADFANALVPTLAEINALWPEPGRGGAGSCDIRYKTCAPTIDRINLEAHGVPLYRDIPAPFFNSYTPYTFGGANIRTPDDCGAHMIPFNLYPGSYQPSGHVNVSRAREFYLGYNSSNVGVSISNADLVIIAIAINFLLISDGSAVLRYST